MNDSVPPAVNFQRQDLTGLTDIDGNAYAEIRPYSVAYSPSLALLAVAYSARTVRAPSKPYYETGIFYLGRTSLARRVLDRSFQYDVSEYITHIYWSTKGYFTAIGSQSQTGDLKKVYKSEDGANWVYNNTIDDISNPIMPSRARINDGVWAKNRFVLVGYRQIDSSHTNSRAVIMTCTDELTWDVVGMDWNSSGWSDSTSFTWSAQLKSICYVPSLDKFIAVSPGNIFTSADGLTWARPNNYISTATRVATNNSKCLAIGLEDVGSNMSGWMYTYDGSTWTQDYYYNHPTAIPTPYYSSTATHLKAAHHCIAWHPKKQVFVVASSTSFDTPSDGTFTDMAIYTSKTGGGRFDADDRWTKRTTQPYINTSYQVAKQSASDPATTAPRTTISHLIDCPEIGLFMGIGTYTTSTETGLSIYKEDTSLL